jgi:hypothetical protein
VVKVQPFVMSMEKKNRERLEKSEFEIQMGLLKKSTSSVKRLDWLVSNQ